MLPTRVAAQANPTITNVILEGGNYSARGKVQAVDPAARTLTSMPEANTPLPMTAAPGVVRVGLLTDRAPPPLAARRGRRCARPTGDRPAAANSPGLEAVQQRWICLGMEAAA
jgi:hypothetical protein